MGQGTESCADRPAEVSVIRFVSRNRTIEEIAPKKEVYMCKQRGCSKTFTNYDEFKTHEAIEALKIRFICREPGCGEELSDPGSMWRHYQEWHNNETNVFICPYTSCSSMHSTSENLEEHIETSHRQPPTIPTEPEIICFEGPDNVIDEEITRSSEGGSYDNSENCRQSMENAISRKEEYSKRNETVTLQSEEYSVKDERRGTVSTKAQVKEDYTLDQLSLRTTPDKEDYSSNESSNRISTKFPKNKDLLITKENFFVKYEAKSPTCNELVQVEGAQEGAKIVFINGDVTITKNPNAITSLNQDHRIDLGNLERVFRSGFEAAKIDEIIDEASGNCSEDEEYTPKKQRMSRYKQEPYKCDVNGCGKMYKYISHYRHHQDSHKLVSNAMNAANVNSTKSVKPKQGKASTVSFFLCKMPGCGAQVNNVTGLWKHYQENHANSKLPAVQMSKTNELFRCKVPGCEMEFDTSFMMYKHFNEVHTSSSMNNVSTNTKTGNGGGVHLVDQTFHDDATAQQVNFETDLKAKLTVNEYTEDDCEHIQLQIVKEESRN